MIDRHKSAANGLDLFCHLSKMTTKELFTEYLKWSNALAKFTYNFPRSPDDVETWKTERKEAQDKVQHFYDELMKRDY